jgi:hydroxyacylglutathione hydrolase
MQLKTLSVGLFEVNCYLVWSESQQVIIIDPGEEHQKIAKYIDKKGLSVCGYLLTHGHTDHVSATAALHRIHPAPIAIHPEDEAWVFSSANAFAPYGVPESFPIGTHLADGDQGRLGDLDYTIIGTPGHTPGGVCIQIEDALFTGDTLFAGSVGRTDLGGGNPRILQDSVNRLAQLDGSLRVFPGHGPSSTIERERRTNFFMRD